MWTKYLDNAVAFSGGTETLNDPIVASARRGLVGGGVPKDKIYANAIPR